MSPDSSANGVVQSSMLPKLCLGRLPEMRQVNDSGDGGDDDDYAYDNDEDLLLSIAGVCSNFRFEISWDTALKQCDRD